MNVGDTIKIASKEQLETVKGEVLTSANSGLSTQFAQHGLVPNDGVNEIRPDDMFEEVDVPDVLVDKKGYPVRFTDGVYNRLGDELVTDELTQWDDYVTINNNTVTVNNANNNTAQLELGLETGKIYILHLDAVETYNQFYLVLGNTTFSSWKDSRRKNINIVFTATYSYISFGDGTASSHITNYINISVKELPQFQLPKAPFSGQVGDVVNGSTPYGTNDGLNVVDILHNDKTNGLTLGVPTQKGSIVVTGNRTLLPTSGNITTEADELVLYNGSGVGGVNGTTYKVINAVSDTDISTIDFTSADYEDKGIYDQSYIATKDMEAGQVIDAREWDTRQSYATDVLVKNNNKVYKCIQSYTAHDMWDTASSYVTDNVVEYNGKVYKALQDADDTIEIGNTDYWEYQRDTVEINSTDYWEYQYDLGFKSIPYVTKQAALLIEKTNDGVINNIALPLINCYGEESIETYEQDIFNELGFSQKADRVYTDGSSEFILLGLKGYLC